MGYITAYYAGSSKDIPKIKALAELLQREFGLISTRDWWEHYVKDDPEFRDLSDTEFYSHPQVQMIENYDVHAINEADLVIVYTEDRYKLTGGMVEIGIALALEKPVICLGLFKRSAMLRRCTHIRTVEGLVEVLRRNK